MIGSVLAQIGAGAQSVAIGWEIYSRTDDALALGLTGLVQALPMMLFTLPAGYLADASAGGRSWSISTVGSAAACRSASPSRRCARRPCRRCTFFFF